MPYTLDSGTTIGVACLGITHPHTSGRVKAFKRMADVQFLGAYDDSPLLAPFCDALGLQARSMDEILADPNVHVVLVHPKSYLMADVLKQARAKGIKIISYDRLIRNSKDFDYYVTFDNYRTGVLQGQSIVDSLALKQGKGPFNLEIFAGSTDDNNAHVVYAGVMSQIKPYIDSGQLVVRSGQQDMDKVATLNWDGALAQARMDNLLSAFYSTAHLDAVLAMNDQVANGVVSSLRGVGYGSGKSAMPIVTGQDAEISSIKSIIRGDQSSTIFKDTRALAQAAAQMMDAELSARPVAVNDTTSYDNGSMIVPTQLLTPQLVDSQNWQKVLVDDTRFYTLEQLH